MERGLEITRVSSESAITFSKGKALLNQYTFLELLTAVEAVKDLKLVSNQLWCTFQLTHHPEKAILNINNLKPVLWKDYN